MSCSMLEDLSSLPHVITLILSYLDMDTLKNTKLSCKLMKEYVKYMMRTPSIKRLFEKRLLVEKWCQRKEVLWKVLECRTAVYELQFVPSCEGRVVAGLNNGDVELWDVSSGKRIRMTDGSGLCNVDSNGDVIVGVSDDSSVIVWDMEGQLIRKFFHHSSSVFCLVVTSNVIITGSMTGEMSVISLENLEVEQFWSPHDSQYGVLDMAVDSERLVTVGKDIVVWSLETVSVVDRIETVPVSSISLSWPLAATATRTANHDCCVQLWNLERREILSQFGDHPVLFVHLDTTKLVVVEQLARQLRVMQDSLLNYWSSAQIVIRPAQWWSTGGSQKREIQLSYQGKLAMAVSNTGLVYSEGNTIKFVDFRLPSASPHPPQLRAI